MATKFAFDHVHSSVDFAVRHMIVSKVHGQFGKWDGELEIDEKDLTRSRVSVKFEAASIDTRVGQRDDHLRSADFLDAANHPLITFTSKRFEKAGEHYRVVGDLTIRGVTKEVVLDTEFNGFVKSPFGDERTGFSARTSFARSDFGLTWNKAIEAGGVMVADKIEVNIDIEAIKQAAAA